jgi:hypothetical protein
MRGKGESYSDVILRLTAGQPRLQPARLPNNDVNRDASNPQLFPDLLDEPPIRPRRDDLVGR